MKRIVCLLAMLIMSITLLCSCDVSAILGQLGIGGGANNGAGEGGEGECLHEDTYFVVTDPTCTEKGTRTQLCRDCEDFKKVETIPALYHDLVSHEGKDVTCTEDGYYEYFTCTRCTYSTKIVRRALGHSFTVAVTDSEPTCTEAGMKHKKCSRCDETAEYTEIPALGHTFGVWEDVVASGGKLQMRECATCGHTEERDTPTAPFAPSGEILAVKDGATSIVVLIHDDGYTSSLAAMDWRLEKYGLVADAALLVDNVVEGGMMDRPRAAYEAFQHYMSNGRWSVINHSLSHRYWGDETTLTVDANKLANEVIKSGEILRKIFPNQRVLTFAYPGISRLTNQFGYDRVYAEIRALVEENYIAGRGFSSSGYDEIGNITWDYTRCATLSDSSINTILANLDKAGESGKFYVYLAHGVEDGPNHNITGENFELVCQKVAGLVESGAVWNTHYEDAALYLREVECATLNVTGDENAIVVTLTDTLNDEIYNYPLTVRVEVPDTFAAVKVVQGDKVSYAETKLVDGKWVADVSVVPDAGDAVITKIAVEDIPEEEEEIVTPPEDEEVEEDDGIVIDASTDFSEVTGLVSDSYTSVVENFDDIHGTVVKYYKETTASGSGRNMSWRPTGTEEIAEALEITFDIYIDRAGTGNFQTIFQMFFAAAKTSPFCAPIQTEANGFRFWALSSSNGGSRSNPTSYLTYDEWHTVTVKVNMATKEHFLVEFYADGQKIGSSKVFNNYYKAADAVPNKLAGGLYFQSYSSSNMLMYLDNISLKAGTLEAMGLPRHGEYHFESSLQNVTNANGYLTTSLSKIGENKTQVLKLVKELGADRVSFYPDLKTEPIAPEAFDLRFDLYLDSEAEYASDTIASVYFNSDTEKSPYVLDIVKADGGFTFGGDVVSDTVLEYDKWYSVKLMVKNYAGADLYAELYEGENLVGTTNGVTAGGREANINGVFIGGEDDVVSTLYLDNLTFKAGDEDEIFNILEMYGIDLNYFPGWTRKAVTFTMDDGIAQYDEKFLKIVRPAGILGTFNLYNVNVANAEAYRERYEGYGIASHCNNHANVFRDGVDYSALITDEPWPGFDKADKSKIYRHPTVEGLYYHYVTGYDWHPIADTEHYLEFAMQTERELEEIFGEGVVKGFVYPNGNQSNQAVVDYLIAQGYTNIRRTYPLAGDDFSMPATRYSWSYNADHSNLLTMMKKFDALADDGELKMFSFGVHPKDFEDKSKWEDLYIFAATYGYRPDDFYYGTVDDIFDYEDALKMATVENGAVINNSETISIYFKVNGEKVVLAPNSAYDIATGEITAR